MEKLLLKNYKIILIALLVGITIFSVFKYVSSLREKYDLLDTLNRLKEQVAALETEKGSLSQALEKEKQLEEQLNAENLALKEDLRVNEEKLTKLNLDFAQVQGALEQLNSELASLKAENTALKEEKVNLNNQLALVAQEKDNLKAKLSSIAELKKAIRELKRQTHKVSKDLKERANSQRVIEGNRGFIIKDGKPTYPAKVKIEVIPAPKNE